MHSSVDIEALNQQIKIDSTFLDDIQREASKVIVGQDIMINRLILSLLSNGHILLEGLPGLAKTLAIKTLASIVDVSYSRIQFTPDLLPADILGTMIFNQKSNEFTVRKGPIFSNFILADEINRAPAKVQSALLEVMQERQVTIGKESFQLEEPFLVLATQNPIEQEGTYPLPEAQTDRFMLKVKIDYPSKAEELDIIRKNISGEVNQKISASVDKKSILRARELVRKIYMDEKVEKYIIDIVFATRNPEDYKLTELKAFLNYGASPRASINLALAARAVAFVNRRAYVIPDDVRDVCYDVMRHRIGVSYEAEAENVSHEDIIREILHKVEVP